MGTPGEGRDLAVRVGAAGESRHRGLSHCNQAREAWEGRLRERVRVWCKPGTIPCPACSQGRIHTQVHGEKGLPGPHQRWGSPVHRPHSTIHPVPIRSPYTDWHRHSRWLCGELRPLRIN